MKFELKLGQVKINNVEVKDVQVSSEFEMKDTKEAYHLIKEVMADAPTLMNCLHSAFKQFESINKEESNKNKETATTQETTQKETATVQTAQKETATKFVVIPQFEELAKKYLNIEL